MCTGDHLRWSSPSTSPDASTISSQVLYASFEHCILKMIWTKLGQFLQKQELSREYDQSEKLK